METYYLAIDIGASSGRHILGSIQNGKIHLEEIYRFENGFSEKNAHLCWNHNKLFQEILIGIRECKRIGKIPCSMSIDTWGVDFILLDEDDNIIGDAISYRDSRTQGMDKKVYEFISEDDLYVRTGIQKAIFNTIYQLMALKVQNPDQLKKARSILMIPDYFQFLLTGKKTQEYTNATTSQLVSPITKDWDYKLIESLGYPLDIFLPIQMPGTELGHFSKEIQQDVGFDCVVVLSASHDTASAVLSVPANDNNFLYISSGTWSLMGIESFTANCSLESKAANFTNEGGYDYRFRYLKNIMGLWMIQSVRKELDNSYSFAELSSMAAECDEFPSIINANSTRFLAPKSMIAEIQQACEESGQQVPHTAGEIASVVYRSLAECYAKTAQEIETITGRSYSRIYVVGGGANAEYLNRLMAKYTGKEVHAGPTEATAIGNIIVQILKTGAFSSVTEARNSIHSSFEIKIY